MRQSIEKQQEAKPSEVAVTVMFHDRRRFLGVSESFRARGNAAPSLSDALVVGVVVFPPASSLPSYPKVNAPRAHLRHPTRRRTSPHIEKFSVEQSTAVSALAVLEANPNARSAQAEATVITTMTEQRRCAAA